MEHTFVHLDVDGTPPDIVLGGILEHNTLVLGAAASLLTGEVDQSTGRGDNGTLVADGVLVEQSDGGVPLDLDAIHVEASLREVLEVLADD